MADPALLLNDRLQAAVARGFGQDFAGIDPILRPSDHADYQANLAMSLAKQVGKAPRDVAETVKANLDLGSEIASVEVAGPGFLNITLDGSYLAQQLTAALDDERLGVSTIADAEKVLVEYSAPNVAKEMHVGHLRTTIIGDALARVFGFLGYEVIRDNHIGDWGTPFGMLIEHLLDLGETEGIQELSVGDLDGFYKTARTKFDNDPLFAERARKRVVELQAGDPETLRLWQVLIDASTEYFNVIYSLLGVLLTNDDIHGESFYNPMLEPVAEELEQRDIAVIDDGALCVFPEGFYRQDKQPLPLMVRKSDGGYGYATSDLAAVRYRVNDVGAKRNLYVVDARQSQHFAMVFAVAKMAGWIPDGISFEHVSFGSVLGEGGKPLKTRAGDTPRLLDLLNEAIERAAVIVAEKNPDLSTSQQSDVARAVGIGAVKYADLSTDRVKDYIFDFDRMLAFEGNTAPYLQYAHARIHSLFRKAERDLSTVNANAIVISNDNERELARKLVSMGQVVNDVAEFLQPHRLCTYLFDVASTYTTFYEKWSVLNAETDELRESRLALSYLTARVLAQGLDLLGIAAPTRM